MQEEPGLHLNGIDCMAQMGIMYTAPTARIQQEKTVCLILQKQTKLLIKQQTEHLTGQWISPLTVLLIVPVISSK